MEVAKISEKTLIPLSLMLAVVSFVFWLSSISFKAEANAQSIKEIRQEQTRYMDDMAEVRESLSRIEGAMGLKHGRK